MKIIAIIQARMSSSRLPEKVMRIIGDHPMLEWVVERTSQAKNISEVVVATTVDPSDDPIYEFCTKKGYLVERGSIHDVLDRYYQTAISHHADVIVRITADCPLIDPALIDQAIELFFLGEGLSKINDEHNLGRIDFVANRLPPPWGRTYPIGLDFEVFTMDSLIEANYRAVSKHQREHVTPYFYENCPPEELSYRLSGTLYNFTTTPDGYRIALLHHTPDFGYLRWTVDTSEDLELIREIISYLPDNNFTWKDILALVKKKPELMQINAQVKHKSHLDVDSRIS